MSDELLGEDGHNAYRDGKVFVCEEKCPTCIFKPGNLMRLRSGRVRAMVDQAKVGESAIICHATLMGDNAVCRGYFDRYGDHVASLRLAVHLGIIEEVDIPF